MFRFLSALFRSLFTLMLFENEYGKIEDEVL